MKLESQRSWTKEPPFISPHASLWLARHLSLRKANVCTAHVSSNLRPKPKPNKIILARDLGALGNLLHETSLVVPAGLCYQPLAATESPSCLNYAHNFGSLSEFVA